jgi:nucleoside-diphosphate-sugar epimerase
MMSKAKTGRMLIVGGTAAAASRLIEEVADRPDWEVTGLCRNPPADSRGIAWVAADLSDPESCRRAVEDRAFTHVVYASRAPHGEDGVEDVPANVAMLRNILAACDGPALRHVHAITGAKWYGVHMGPFRTPARESDPAHLPPNFYFDLQEFLESASRGSSWTWSTSRPNIISDVSVGRGRNLLSTIGAYAAICKHLGRPLDFPGKPGAYTSLQEMTDAGLLAKAILWMSTTPEVGNEAYNVVNGDAFRWENIWPRLAEHFGMEMGRVRHFSLVRWMADKGAVWDEIVSKKELLPLPLESVAQWDFADFLLGWDYDVMCSMTKARKAGFFEFADTEEMILDQLSAYRERRVLP